MSYSFWFSAPNKDAAKTMAAQKFDADVIASQPIHEKDREAALANAAAIIDLVHREPNEGEEISVSMNGSLSWSEGELITGATANTSAYLRTKPVQA